MHDDRSVLEALLGDGRFLLALCGVMLALGGWFAILQSAAGHFLPHDVHALGYDAAQLADAANPKLVQFMFHDRVAFGGTLLSIGFAYWWLAEFPLKARAAWAWWTFCLSGLCGFASFLSYLGYGYLDTWHGVATLFLLPVFLCGLWRARPPAIALGDVWRSPEPMAGGRLLLALVALGLVCGGVTIMIVGMTSVFVPQDLTFMELTRDQIRGMSPRLVPVIAHDRSGFGGGLFSMGVILALMARHAPITRSFVQIVTLMGVAGFGATLGVHFAIGYTDVTHLAPAYVGCALFLVALVRLARASLSPLVDAAVPPTADRRGS